MRGRNHLFPLLSLLVATLLGAACSDVRDPTAPTQSIAADGLPAVTPVTVMTRNMYLGADVERLLNPSLPLDQALALTVAELEHTDYPARAPHLAAEIASHMPDVVGLQEVSHFDILTAAGTQTIDFLDILQAYLAAMGADYDVAVRQNNLSLPVPVGFGGIISITYTDGDAILVRHGVPWSNPDAGRYVHQALLSLPPYSFTNERGWVSVVATVGESTFRFVDTHLETQDYPGVGAAESQELVDLLAGEPLPVILVGDFNSAANHDAAADRKTATYGTLRGAGFQDLWVREPHSDGGLTCCHASDLSDANSDGFTQRIDFIWARIGQAGFGGQSSVDIVGKDPSDRFMDDGYFLWPSDHAGLVATMWLAPGLLTE